MFFIFGVSTGEKQLDFSQLCTCKSCGRMGRYEAFVTYTVFTLFFIPLFKWGKRYFVREAGCGCTSEISGELGRRIERGEKVVLDDSDLNFNRGDRSNGVSVCGSCGYTTDQQFTYCPMCGKPFRM